MVDSVFEKSLKILATLSFSLLLGTPGFAQSDLTCQSGSGVWQNTSQHLQIDGVLCASAGESPDFYRLSFDENNGLFAPTIPNLSGDLRYLFASPQVIFYTDDTAVYALEREHFKVIWHMPWKNAQKLPLDPSDNGHFAIWSKGDNGSEIHLLRTASGRVEEEMSAQLGPEPPLQIVWHPKRLVIIEKDKMTYWPRPGIPLPTDPNNPTEQPNTPADWKTSPVVESISPTLNEGEYVLDPNGLMVLNRSAKKLSYYRFNTSSWTTARINATASIHALGKGTEYAMAVTIDMNTVRVVARLGSFLQNRFEAKYWKLPGTEDTITVIGQDDIAALDGGTDNRIQTIDTTEMTWKRLALIDFTSPGRIAELVQDELITIHPTGSDTIVFWNARTGSKLDALSAEKLSDFGPVKSVQSIPGIHRYKLITSQNGMFIIYDKHSKTLSKPLPFESVPWSDLPKAIDVLPEAMIIHSDKVNPSQWDIYPADSHKKIYSKTLSDLKAESFGELQTPQEKWYGYCLNDSDCFVSTPNPPEQTKKAPSVITMDDTFSHAPNAFSWFLCFLAFLAMFAVMLWRHGFGKKSLLKAEIPEDDLGLTPTDIFDNHNRRYISDRDNRFFLAPHFYSTPLFRVLLSVLLGPAIGLAIVAHVFYDDTFITFISWIIVLGMPISAITWIATSWTYWNRYYLLRFGGLTEGKWINCAQTNPSIVYEPIQGKTYELSRNQWSRVDFVPLVLFDPTRPQFAIQYTGVVSHSISKYGDLTASPMPACAFDFNKLCLVLGILAVTLVSTQLLFQHAYPNPLSAWKLDSIAQEVPPESEDMTFTLACLNACDDDDVACSSQCHQRQLKLVLEQADMPLDSDPVMTTAEFLNNYRNEIARARSIALEQPELSCDERESLLATIALWPDKITAAFWNIYGNIDTFYAAELTDIYEGLKKDADTFKALCDLDGACAKSSANCPVPPQCPGRITSLKTRICAFHNALNVPELNINEYDLTDIDEE